MMMMFTTGKFDIYFGMFMVTTTISLDRSFKVTMVMWSVDIQGSRMKFVFVLMLMFGSKRKKEKNKKVS